MVKWIDKWKTQLSACIVEIQWNGNYVDWILDTHGVEVDAVLASDTPEKFERRSSRQKSSSNDNDCCNVEFREQDDLKS